jgi:Phage tail tube protein, TTP
MSVPKGRNCRVEIAATFDASTKTVTAVTKAVPPVVTSTAHGYLEGAIAFFETAVGMDELLGQVVSVDATAANTFNAEGLDSTNFGTFTSGTLRGVATWLTLSSSTAYEIPEGSADALDATTLLDRIKQEQAGLLAAQSVQLSKFSDMQLPALAVVRSAALNAGFIVVRITLDNGERRVFRGQPGLPGESMSVGQLATSGLGIKVKGQVLMLPAA